MEKNITAIGEVLVDRTCLNRTLDINETDEFINKTDEFVNLPGGAPANVSVGLAKLGYPVQFIGGFSDDTFGIWLKEYISDLGVDVTKSQEIKNSNTRCAYVYMDKNENRVFKGFSKDLCADSMLDFEKIDIVALKKSSIFYTGSLIQACEKSRETLNRLLDAIKSEDIIKIYDPNLRLFLWSDVQTAIRVIKDTIPKFDVLKLSDDEINLITGIDNDIETAAEKVFSEYDNLKLLAVTLGRKGSYFLNKNGNGFIKSFKVNSVEMTGAGDGFVTGLLGGIYDLSITNKELAELDSDTIIKIMTKANAIGALATTKPGAMSALPTKEELAKFPALKV